MLIGFSGHLSVLLVLVGWVSVLHYNSLCYAEIRQLIYV